MNDLTVALHYIGHEGDRWTLLDLKREEGLIDFSDRAPAPFSEALGGLSLYQDRIQCFLNCNAAGDLLSYVHFLLGSLAALSGQRLEPAFERLRPDPDFMGFSDVVGGLIQIDGSLLVLQTHDESLRLSYLDARLEAPERRLSPYFRDFPLVRSAWIQSCQEALDEYFQLAESILQGGSEADDGSHGLEDLVELWRRVRPELDQAWC